MRIYFSGIGGVGIGPLCEIARDAGYEVCGSDRESGLMSKQIEDSGIEVSYDQSGAFLRQQHQSSPFDWFVYTAALPTNHPELTAAKELGIRTAKRDELLAYVINQKNLKLIAVAGTHGKTSTCGMLVWTLQQLGIPISYSVGSTLSFGPSGVYEPRSEYFIYECDEFDRNFLHFTPWLSIITSVGYDHPDTYPTEAEYLEAFEEFGNNSRHIICQETTAQLFEASKTTVLSGANPAISLVGQHNRANASLVLEALDQMSQSTLDIPTATEALNLFAGTSRRFEMLAPGLYSDYGHHPVEIAATLQMASELSNNVVLVYQPHQNVRQHEIRLQYIDSVFKDAKQIYWLPTYLSRENSSLPILTPEQLTENMSAEVTLSELNDDLWRLLKQHLAAGHLVLCMGAGSIDGWLRSQVAS